MPTLADMQPEAGKVKITNAYGKVLELTLGTLSYIESEEIALSVNRPVPPQRIDEKGKYVPNYDDLRFQRAWTEMGNEIVLRRLGRMLQKGGSFAEFEGKTLAEIAKILRTWDSAMVNTLTGVLTQVLSKGETHLESLASNFPAIPVSHHESVPSEGLDS